MSSCTVCMWEIREDRLVDTSRTKTAWAVEVGSSEKSIRRHLAHPPRSTDVGNNVPQTMEQGEIRNSYSYDEDSNGSIKISKTSDRIIPLSEWLEDLRTDGHDPDDFNTSHGHSVWAQRSNENGEVTLYANKFSAVKKPAKDRLSKIDWAAASKFIENFIYLPARRDFLVDAAILQPTDEQWGKTDFAGGTPETEERVMSSYAAFADYVREYRPRQVLFAHTGDGVENFCSTAGQRDTNDLDLPHQLVQTFKADLAGIRMIAPLVGELINAYVPSNHGRWRVGPKGDAGDAHADFGISTAKQVQIALSMGSFDNVSVIIPEPHMESMAVQLETARIGLVHGHQASGADKMGEWWKGQDHGRMPTWDCDYLFVGHWHQYRAYLSGDSRHVFIGPASDPGSSWFANLKGERSSSGMLAISLIGKQWKYQDIL